MDVFLDKEDYNEILRYAGRKNADVDDVIWGQLRESVALVNKIASVRTSWRLFELAENEKGIALKGTDAVLTGESIRKHLCGAKRAVLFCLTLGPMVDREIEKLMLTNKGLAVLVNAAAVALVEKAGDALLAEIDTKLSGNLKTGTRFSPGYGDLPLEFQKDFMRLLDMERSVGIRLTEGLLMKPEKSITAIAKTTEE